MTSERVKAIEERLERSTLSWMVANKTPLHEQQANRDAFAENVHDDLAFLLAERDRLAAEVEAARAVADEMHVNMRRIRNERDDLLAALEKIKRHGCCVMHSDSGCPGCTAHDALARLGERDRLAAELDRVTTERRNVLSELSRVAFKLGTTEAHLDAAREALETARYDLERIMTADWTIEQARLGAKSGAHQVREALARLAKLKEAE